MCLGASRECGRLLMAHVNPMNLLSGANRIRDSVERVAADAVNSLNSSFQQNIDKQISYSLCHVSSSSNSMKSQMSVGGRPSRACFCLAIQFPGGSALRQFDDVYLSKAVGQVIWSNRATSATRLRLHDMLRATLASHTPGQTTGSYLEATCTAAGCRRLYCQDFDAACQNADAASFVCSGPRHA